MKTAITTCLFLLAVLPFPSWAAESQARPATTEVEPRTASPHETLEAFRQEHRALIAEIPQAWRVRFAPRDAIPGATIAALHSLSSDLLEWLDTLSGDQPDYSRLFTSWTSIFKDVFTLRVMLDWQSFEPAWQEFQRLQPRLAETASQLSREHAAKTTATIAGPILRLYVREHHETLLPWMNDFESRHLSDTEGNLPSWWLKSRCDYAMVLTGSEGDPDLVNTGKQWLLEHLRDPSVSQSRRASIATRYALQMHSLGQPEAAASILDWWEKQHPDLASQDMRFLHISFFVHQIGHGNREAARRILERLDSLVESGSLCPEDDRFRVVTQNYYRNLRHTDLDHAMLTSQLLESRNASLTE
jgi:hypothetical protein